MIAAGDQRGSTAKRRARALYVVTSGREQSNARRVRRENYKAKRQKNPWLGQVRRRPTQAKGVSFWPRQEPKFLLVFCRTNRHLFSVAATFAACGPPWPSCFGVVVVPAYCNARANGMRDLLRELILAASPPDLSSCEMKR